MVAAKDVKLLLLGKRKGSVAAGLLRPGAAQFGLMTVGLHGAEVLSVVLISLSALCSLQAAGSLEKAQLSNR